MSSNLIKKFVNSPSYKKLKKDINDAKKENEKLREEIKKDAGKVFKFDMLERKGGLTPYGTKLSEKTGCLILKSGYKWQDKKNGKAVKINEKIENKELKKLFY